MNIYIYNPLNSFSISKYTHPPAPIGETRGHPPHCDHQWWLLATDGRESAGVHPWCAKATWYREENQEEVQTRFFQHQEFWVHHECRQNEECQTFHHRMAMQAPLGFKTKLVMIFFDKIREIIICQSSVEPGVLEWPINLSGLTAAATAWRP